MTDGLIFTGFGSKEILGRAAGAYRMRTWLKRNNYNIEVIDFFDHFSDKELFNLCKKFINDNTLFVGVSTTFFSSTDRINSLFGIIKTYYPDVKTVIGGTEGDLPGLITTNVDRYFWGYAEDAFLHYLDFLSRKRNDDLKWFKYKDSLAINSEQGFKNDSSDLSIEWEKNDLLNKNLLPLEISRGCIFRCRFCQYPLLGKKKNDYIRYEENLADEIKRNYEFWGINNYSFSDDTFNDNIIKLEHVANAIVKSGVKITYSCYLRADLLAKFPEMAPILYETGNIAGHFGLESMNENAKKAIGKGMDNEQQFEAIRHLKSFGPYWSFTGMIVGLPGESIDSIIKSQEWLLKQNKEVFDDWSWFPLIIRKNAVTRKSEFDINYEKWGYAITDSNNFYSKWSNEYMTFDQAADLSARLNLEIENTKKLKNHIGSIGHWHVSDLIGAGFTIEDIIEDKVDLFEYTKALEKDRKDIENYKKIKLKNSNSFTSRIKLWINP